MDEDFESELDISDSMDFDTDDGAFDVASVMDDMPEPMDVEEFSEAETFDDDSFDVGDFMDSVPTDDMPEIENEEFQTMEIPEAATPDLNAEIPGIDVPVEDEFQTMEIPEEAVPDVPDEVIEEAGDEFETMEIPEEAVPDVPDEVIEEAGDEFETMEIPEEAVPDVPDEVIEEAGDQFQTMEIPEEAAPELETEFSETDELGEDQFDELDIPDDMISEEEDVPVEAPFEVELPEEIPEQAEEVPEEMPEQLDEVPEEMPEQVEEVPEEVPEQVEEVPEEVPEQVEETAGEVTQTPEETTEQLRPRATDEALEQLQENGPGEVQDVPETGPSVETVELPESEREYDDFETLVRLDAPDFYEEGEFYVQGINEYQFEGTCGETSVANTVNRVLGTNEFTENKVLDLAVQEGLCYTEGINPADNGGTTTGELAEIYNRINEQTGGQLDVGVYECGDVLSMDEVAQKLDEGCTINVAVDADTLWDQADPMGAPRCKYTDHWITVTGAHRDDTGAVTGFDIIDSGGGVGFVDSDKYEAMCFGSDNLALLDPTCVVVQRADIGPTVQPLQPAGDVKPEFTGEFNENNDYYEQFEEEPEDSDGAFGVLRKIYNLFFGK